MGRMSKLLDRLSGSRSVAPTTTAGSPGFAVFGGYVSNEERDPRLVGAGRWITYTDLLTNVSIVAAGVRYFLNLVAQPAWKVVPVSDDEPGRRAAELVEDALYDMRRPWYRVVRRAALYRFYGFGFQEWTAKKNRDGSIGLLDVAPRPHHTIERWDVQPDGSLTGVTQRSPTTGQEIYLPRGKVVYCVEDSLTDHPEGIGLLRHVVEPANRLKLYEGLEHIGFVTDLRGVPIARAPLREMNDQVKNNLMTTQERDERVGVIGKWVDNHIKSIHSGILFDSETFRDEGPSRTPSASLKWNLDLVQGGSVGLEEINVAVSRLVYDIARVLGVEHLLIGSDGTGSLALSKTKSHDFALTVDSTLTELCEVMMSDLVVPICDLNGVPEELRPDLTTEAIQHQDPTELTAALRDLATAGAPLGTGDPAVNEVRSLLGLSDAPEEDDVEGEIDASLLERDPPPDAGADDASGGGAEDDVVGEGDKAPDVTKRRRRRR